MYEPKAVAVHHESAIRGTIDDARHVQWFVNSKVRLVAKYTDADFAPFAHDFA
jgi:hypothetical protein